MKKHFPFLLLLFGPTAFAVFVFVNYDRQNPTRSLTAAEESHFGKVAQEDSATITDRMRFLRGELEPIIVGQLGHGEYPIPEIQKRFDHIYKVVSERESVGMIEVSFVTSYSYAGPNAFAGAVMANGKPTIEVYVPAMMDLFHLVRQTSGSAWMEVARHSVALSLMHEMEHHLAGDPLQPTKNLEEMVSNEARAWDNTCRYSIAPSVEKYGLGLEPNDQIYFDNWIAADRGRNTQQWESFIRDVYREVDAINNRQRG